MRKILDFFYYAGHLALWVMIFLVIFAALQQIQKQGLTTQTLEENAGRVNGPTLPIVADAASDNDWQVTFKLVKDESGDFVISGPGIRTREIKLNYGHIFIGPHSEPAGGGCVGEEKTAYADNDGWYCYDEQGRRWPSYGECD